MMVLYVLLAWLGVALVSWAYDRAVRAQVQRMAALPQIAAHLHGTHDVASAAGSLHGVAVRFHFDDRGLGSSVEHWTLIEAELPASYPLAIHVRPHGWTDRALRARGEMVDVKLGDAAFDAAFLVEAAPEDVARQLLDAGARGLLLSHRRAELDTVSDESKRVLRLALRGWLEDPGAALHAIEHVARIAAQVRAAYAETQPAQSAQLTGAPYRPQLDEPPPRDAAGEVAALDAQRTRRPDPSGLQRAVTSAATLLATGAALLALAAVVRWLQR